MTNLRWIWVDDDHRWPTEEGWYRVLHPGDYDAEGAHVYYDYPDYEGWAYWSTEDTDDEYPGTWFCEHDEDGFGILTFCGPIEVPERPERN